MESYAEPAHSTRRVRVGEVSLRKISMGEVQMDVPTSLGLRTSIAGKLPPVYKPNNGVCTYRVPPDLPVRATTGSSGGLPNDFSGKHTLYENPEYCSYLRWNRLRSFLFQASSGPSHPVADPRHGTGRHPSSAVGLAPVFAIRACRPSRESCAPRCS